MKTLIVIFTILIVATLAGCANPQNLKDLLTDLDKDCVRHYAGSIASGVPASGTLTFQIDCQPSATIKPAAAPPGVTPGP